MKDEALWRASRLGDLIALLARRCGYARLSYDGPSPPSGSQEELFAWAAQTASALGSELSRERSSYRTTREVIRSGRGMIIIIPGRPWHFVGLIEADGKRARLLGTDANELVMDVNVLLRAVFADIEEPLEEAAAAFAAALQTDVRRSAAARRTFLEQHLAGSYVERLWRLRHSPHASVIRRMRDASIPSRVAGFAIIYAAQYALLLTGWALIGGLSLDSRVDIGWLVAWTLILATIVPLQTTCAWLQNTISVRIGTIIKESILAAGLKANADEMRREGPSHLLARALEAQTIENAIVTGGFYAIVGAVELTFAASVLALGIGGLRHVLLLIVWSSSVLFAWYIYYRRRISWTAERLSMSHDLAEKMVGYRTRLAQLPAAEWHEAEDRALSAYYASSRVMDNLGVAITPLAWHGWIAAGVLGIISSSFGTSFDPVRVAVSFGGVLLAGGALRRWTLSLTASIDALVAWRQIRPFLAVLPRPQNNGIAAVLPTPADMTERTVVLSARGLSYAHAARSRPVIDDWNLEIRDGDRLLLEGASGSGKSTLAALLSSLRQPTAGTILFRGLDRHTLGDANWRRRVVGAPQFHENHLFAETLAFNLLMGKRWPPTGADFEEAETVCRELGLDGLLSRMPSGLMQIVGETGWQLSHGERSRVFIARALLQGADVVILDESFAALDPVNFEHSMRCVLSRARSLLVIAHP